MNPFRNLSTQFHVIHTKGELKGNHELTLTSFDSGNLANVFYEHHTDPSYDLPSRIEVGYLKSNREGKGHAKALMQHLYDRYPKSHIDWGLTIHPAATHLAEGFENKYYDRTSYQPEEELDEEDWNS